MQPAERAGGIPSHEVDVTLIDEMLRMSPTERLRQKTGWPRAPSRCNRHSPVGAVAART